MTLSSEQVPKHERRTEAELLNIIDSNVCSQCGTFNSPDDNDDAPGPGQGAGSKCTSIR